jgi:hypothetical protein
MRTMYDSTNPTDIPRDATIVAYYVDGKFTWEPEWLDLFPDAVKVSISAIGERTAHVGDVEPGCIWPPSNAVDWVLRSRADGYDPTLYVNQTYHWRLTEAEFANRGVPSPHWWVANYDNKPTIPPGAVAKQYAHPPQTGSHYDKSAVLDYWPGVDGREQDMGVAEIEAKIDKLTVWVEDAMRRIQQIHLNSGQPLPPDSNGDPDAGDWRLGGDYDLFWDGLRENVAEVCQPTAPPEIDYARLADELVSRGVFATPAAVAEAVNAKLKEPGN